MITDVYRRNNPYVKIGASFIGFNDLYMYWGSSQLRIVARLFGFMEE